MTSQLLPVFGAALSRAPRRRVRSMGEKTGSERKGGALFVTAAVLFGGMLLFSGTMLVRELAQAKESGLTEEIIRYHLEQLRLYGYPEKGLKRCTFASQEECDRKYDGNWYYYYK